MTDAEQNAVWPWECIVEGCGRRGYHDSSGLCGEHDARTAFELLAEVSKIDQRMPSELAKRIAAFMAGEQREREGGNG